MNARIIKHFGAQPVVWVAAWGISKLRKRAGRFAGGIEGEGLWYDDWYARVMSSATIDKLAGLGVNLVILPFSLGGSARAEQAERDDFERVTALLHARGMVSVPYLQYQNILQEDFVFPATTWGVKLNGDRKQYSYWRRTVCQSSAPFREYIKTLISDAVQRGADGVWIDNTHLAPCRCEECQTMFRRWLDANCRDLLDDLYLDDFKSIDMPDQIGNAFDPIVRALIDFNCRRNLDIMGEFKNHLDACRPDALFGSNPGLYRGNSSDTLYGMGVDLRPFLGLHDLMYLENKFFPCAKDGQVTGNYHGCIACESAGAMAVPGGWKHGDFDDTRGVVGAHTHGFPSKAEEIRRALFEAAAFGGAVSMLWAVRALPEDMCASADDLLNMYIEHPAIETPTRQALAFLRELPVFGATANLANIGILYHRATLAFQGTTAWPAVHAAEEMLLGAGLPYNVVFSEDFEEQASKIDLIILPEVSVLGEREVDQIGAYVRRGGRILVLGNHGLYTENMRTRPDFALKDLTGVSRFKRPDEIVLREAGAGQCACLPVTGFTKTRIANIMRADPLMLFPRWYEARAGILSAIDGMLGERRQVVVAAPHNAAVSLRSAAGGHTAVHMLCYQMHTPGVEAGLKLRRDLASAETAVWHTPDGGRIHVTPQTAPDGFLRYHLPDLRDYGVLIV